MLLRLCEEKKQHMSLPRWYLTTRWSSSALVSSSTGVTSWTLVVQHHYLTRPFCTFRMVSFYLIVFNVILFHDIEDIPSHFKIKIILQLKIYSFYSILILNVFL